MSGLTPLLQYLYTPSAQGIVVEGRESREKEDCGLKLSQQIHSFPTLFETTKTHLHTPMEE